MNWSELGAAAELVGAIAVVVTLVYLAIQIRQNTRSVATATYDSVMTGFNDLNVELMRDPDLLSLYLRGTEHPESLTEAEGTRFVLMIRCYANQWEKLLRLYQAGALPAAAWRSYAPEAAQILGTPGGRLFQRDNSNFRELYEALRAYDGATASEFRLRVNGIGA